MLLADTLLALSVSLGITVATLSAWNDLRASQHSAQILEQWQAQQRELQRLVDRLSLQAGATVIAPNASGAWQWVLKPAAVDGTEGTRDDTVSWHLPRDMDPRDCQGNQVSSLDLIAHQFKLSNKQELTCKDSARTGTLFQALAERVEDLQVLYAQALPSPGTHPGLAPLQWTTAAQVVDWRQVRAVSWCLRWSSPTPLWSSSPAMTGCQGEVVPADGRMRRLQRSTWQLSSQGDA